MHQSAVHGLLAFQSRHAFQDNGRAEQPLGSTAAAGQPPHRWRTPVIGLFR